MSITDSQQVLERLARQGAGQVSEGFVVASPGARAAAWAVKVKSHVSRNVYNVRAVVIGDTGSIPVEIGEQVEAVNVAESFLAEGTLPVGSYAVMFRVGEKNVFYAKS
jgi:hypothetical protein